MKPKTCWKGVTSCREAGTGEFEKGPGSWWETGSQQLCWNRWVETGDRLMKEDVNDRAKSKDGEPLEEGERNWKGKRSKRNKGKGEGQVVRSYGRRTEQRGAENRPERVDKWILGVGTNRRRTGTGWARTKKSGFGEQANRSLKESEALSS